MRIPRISLSATLAAVTCASTVALGQTYKSHIENPIVRYQM